MYSSMVAKIGIGQIGFGNSENFLDKLLIQRVYSQFGGLQDNLPTEPLPENLPAVQQVIYPYQQFRH